jgi:RNase P/RNase MRP subunit POP5
MNEVMTMSEVTAVPVLIHVRFAPNGAVTEIAERPESATAQVWFDYLTTQMGEAFQPLSGGRGVFRIERESVEQLKASLANYLVH